MSSAARVAQMRILRLPIQSDYLERIAGTAWPSNGSSSTTHPHQDVSRACLRGEHWLPIEIDVTEELLDGQGRLAQAFVITIIDERVTFVLSHCPARLITRRCVSSAVATVDAKGGAGMSTVSLSLNTTFHNPASLGSTLRFISTTMAAAGGIQSCRSVWDLREQHLVATAVFCGMLSSPLKAKAARL
ncbi:hypothetical protein C8F01DRAFT_1253048 [Mycena amicta]|nr:hypothetical protein C8F01DRAFT_1253048 [Mycena amicta]